MKKLLPILVVLTMVLAALPAVLGATPTDPEKDTCGWDECSEADYLGEATDITTSVTVLGDPTNGDPDPLDTPVKPVVKCKWEYDLDVQIPIDECDEPCPDCGDHTTGYWEHDACCCLDGLQVKPKLGQSVKVGFYAVVYDPQGKDNIRHVWADVWHPDGTFKYQIELFPVGFISGTYYNNQALDEWDHVQTCHPTLITINQDWANTLSGYIPGTVDPTTGIGDPMTPEWDIWHELYQKMAYLYYGEAYISYCQPGGWYHVGIVAEDFQNHWSEWLDNYFWYIPTSGIEVDFNTVDYGDVEANFEKWVSGDWDMQTPPPTVKNIGNTPVDLYVWQDDMGFDKRIEFDTSGNRQEYWNVKFDARLGAGGTDTYYYPEEQDVRVPLLDSENPENPINFYPGVRIGEPIPSVKPEGDYLGLCTEEKLDFSIHVLKAASGDFTGVMKLFACIHGDPIWDTPEEFIMYNGPTEPGII